MRVLLVAPRTNLLLADAEVQSILRSGLKVTPLLGDVTHVGLMREMLTGYYDALWFCTHGNADGIILSDGPLLPTLLVPLVRHRVRLVVLNTCDSDDIARQLQNDTQSHVIATVVDVPDQEAFQTGALLANELATHGNIARAYHNSKPGGNRTYIWLAGTDEMRDEQGDRHYSHKETRGWPSYAEELDAEMIELFKAMERLLGEVNLLRYRVQQLEVTTKVGIALYAVTIAILLILVLWR